MAIDTTFSAVIDKCIIEYSQGNVEPGFVYYVVPVYKKEGSYYFALIRCEEGTDEEELKAAVKQYSYYSVRGWTSYDSDKMKFHLKGVTISMDLDVKDSLIRWLEQSRIVEKNGDGKAEDYVIPIVFCSMNYKKTRTIGYLLLAGIVICLVIPVVRITLRIKKKKKPKRFGSHSLMIKMTASINTHAV